MKRRADVRRPEQSWPKLTVNATRTPVGLIGAASQNDGTSRWTNPAHLI
jgi:hypothetical protein